MQYFVFKFAHFQYFWDICKNEELRQNASGAGFQ